MRKQTSNQDTDRIKKGEARCGRSEKEQSEPQAGNWVDICFSGKVGKGRRGLGQYLKGLFYHVIDGVMINRLLGKVRKGFIQGIDSRPLLCQSQSARCESGPEEEATNFVLSGFMWKCLRIVAGKAEGEPETVRRQNIKNVRRKVSAVPAKETCCSGEGKQQALEFGGQDIAYAGSKEGFQVESVE